MASDPDRLSVDATREAFPEGGPGADAVEFRQRMAVMPRLLDDSDLEPFRASGLAVEDVRRARRQYFRELLADLERESANWAREMAQAPEPNFAEIAEFRRGIRAQIRQLRVLAFLHGMRIRVDAASRKRSASLSAIMLAAQR
ncbi:MAG TPA: hypothetical protein VFA04_20740 [Bryobacteraceae bacterium]|nr:hypothetical protein [Bryobacteraceae bacterium]